MRTISWTLILLALISALWAFLIDMARATQTVTNPYKSQLSAQGIAGPVVTLPKKNCKTRDHGLWGTGKDRKRIKTTWCRGDGDRDFKYVTTWVGKWAKL